MAAETSSDFFSHFPMRLVRASELDEALREPVPERLTILFLWGRDCPNCDIAKRAVLMEPERFCWPDVRWFHDNVYDDFDMATRFGLHGIPAYFVFLGRRLQGRITGWPGREAFTEAIERQLRSDAAVAGG